MYFIIDYCVSTRSENKNLEENMSSEKTIEKTIIKMSRCAGRDQFVVRINPNVVDLMMSELQAKIPSCVLTVTDLVNFHLYRSFVARIVKDDPEIEVLKIKSEDAGNPRGRQDPEDAKNMCRIFNELLRKF